jgi:Flp pilus assembly protein TadD
MSGKAAGVTAAQHIALALDSARAHYNAGRLQEAERICRAVIAQRPGHLAALKLLGNVLVAANHHAEALKTCNEALLISPTDAEALTSRAAALLGLNRNEEAQTAIEQALKVHPKNAGLSNLSGIALVSLGRFDDAIVSFQRGASAAPDNALILRNLGNALSAVNRVEEALASFRRAQALAPTFAEAHFDESVCLLSIGDFAQGWQKYEWRWRQSIAHAKRRDFAQPLWLGDADVSGKTILLHAEQGFGDTLQFCRYAPLLARTANVVLAAPQPLVRLLSTLQGVSRIVAGGEPLPGFDLHCPLLSLPLAFATTGATIPNDVPYLRADPTQAACWRRRVADLPGIRVGLVWSGNARLGVPALTAIDKRRSTTLERLAPLGQVSGVSLVSLQKGDRTGLEQATLPGLPITDWTDELDDFADTAALIEALDLVISVDTSVVHLAGALGKPVWVLNRYDACWRWLRGRSDSPWYPTARLFRQPAPGDWDGMIAEVVATLRHWQPSRSE